MTATIVYSISATVGFAACAYWICWVQLRHHGEWTTNRAATVGYSGLFGLACLLSVPQVVAAADAVIGVDELTRLFKHLCVLAVAACSQFQLLYLAYPEGTARSGIRRRLWAWLAAAALLVLMFVIVRDYPQAVQTKVEYARVPAVTAYLGVYLAAMGWYAFDTARLCWRFSRITPRRWTRRGFRLTALGGCVTLAYCLTRAFYVLSYWVGDVPPGERIISPVLVMTAGVLCMVGLSMPTWGPGIDAVARWWRYRRAYRTLYPLWSDLTRVTPDLVLDEQFRHGRAPLRDVEYALTRRIVEICDARLALRPYIDADLATPVHGTDEDALAEAGRIAAGIQGRMGDQPAARPSTDELYDAPGGYDGQVAWLVRVSAAYQSPLVARPRIDKRIDAPATVS